MTHPTHESNATRTVVLAVAAWGVVAAGIAASGVFAYPGPAAAIATALALATIACAAYAADDELREAACLAPRTKLLAWALAFDAATVLLVAVAALGPAPLARAMASGIGAMAPLFAAPLAIAFHAAAFNARPTRKVRLSAPARSPERSPAGT